MRLDEGHLCHVGIMLGVHRGVGKGLIPLNRFIYMYADRDLRRLTQPE